MSGHLCPACSTRYAYELPACTFCGAELEPVVVGDGVVVAVTRVDTPSTGHEDVPYWCALVIDEAGSQSIIKLDRPVAVGDAVGATVAAATEVFRVGIIGSGVMARGLAEMLLFRGHAVEWVGRSAERLEEGLAHVKDRLSRVMDEAEVARAVASADLSTDIAELAGCDIVIEAVVEKLEPKRAILEKIERALPPETFLATNTSSLPLDELSRGMERPERFGGLHFFNPPTRMRLVEVVRAPATSDDAEEFLMRFATAVGKVPVRVAAGPGFVVNRVLMPLLNEAVRALEDGIAKAEDIDEAVRLGLNHPMGPLALSDLIGLDVVVSIMEDLHARLGDEAYAPRPLLREMVAEGRLGRKTGSGFYPYG